MNGLPPEQMSADLIGLGMPIPTVQNRRLAYCREGMTVQTQIGLHFGLTNQTHGLL
jgi:hypothetical protein